MLDAAGQPLDASNSMPPATAAACTPHTNCNHLHDSMTPALLITAGPTHEPIDAVRYIGNRSSGRMGQSLAEEAARRGLPVTLLLGPTNLAPPSDSRIAVHRFRTTAELQRLLADHWPRHDVLIMAAAVADYRPVRPSEDAKLRRGDTTLTLELEPTSDLLAEAAASKRPGQVIIGFALEPHERLLESASAKLRRKNVDAIVANPLETMESDQIIATLILADGRVAHAPPAMSKPAFAAWLLDHLGDLTSRASR